MDTRLVGSATVPSVQTVPGHYQKDYLISKCCQKPSMKLGLFDKVLTTPLASQDIQVPQGFQRKRSRKTGTFKICVFVTQSKTFGRIVPDTQLLVLECNPSVALC